MNRKSAKATITIGTAGFIKLDSEGYANGILKQVEMTTSLMDGEEVEQIEWIWEVESTKGKSKMYLWTSPNINPNKYISRPGQTEPEYSALTQLLLRVGYLTEENLADLQQLSSQDQIEQFLEDLDIDLETLVGATYRFKLIQGKPGKPSKPDIKTLELLEVAQEPELE